MEVPVSARSARLDTLVVGLAAVDGDSAELCVGQPGSASERMPLGPMAWCWSLRETESGAGPDTAAAPPAPPSHLPEPAPPERGLPPPVLPGLPRSAPCAAAPGSSLGAQHLLRRQAVPWAPQSLLCTDLASRLPSLGLPRAS